MITSIEFENLSIQLITFLQVQKYIMIDEKKSIFISRPSRK